MVKDAYWNDVVLAMHMDGVDTSQTFYDLKGNSVSVFGQAQHKTATKKFGASSAYFDGTGDYLTIPDSNNFYYGSGDFTIEAWINPSVLSQAAIVSQWGSDPNSSWIITIDSGGYITIAYTTSGAYQAGNSVSSQSGAISANTWTHVAAVRYGNSLKMYVGGVAYGSKDVSGAVFYNPSTAVVIGSTSILSFPYNGYIDDLRITKGVARYTADFTPPTEPFPNGPYEVGGLIVDSNAQPVSRTVRVYDRVTGALAGSGQSSPVTGIYNVAINTANEVQVVMLDDALGTLENDQIIRTTPV